ncbi:MAG TPA: zinc-ribbon domain-containing protein, partial [Thermoplasmata archaeon]
KRPGGGAGGAAATRPAVKTVAATPARAASPARAAVAAPAAAAAPAPAPTPVPATATAAAAMKPCSNCGKEIPPDYLVCPFCGAVTQ